MALPGPDLPGLLSDSEVKEIVGEGGETNLGGVERAPGSCSLGHPEQKLKAFKHPRQAELGLMRQGFLHVPQGRCASGPRPRRCPSERRPLPPWHRAHGWLVPLDLEVLASSLRPPWASIHHLKAALQWQQAGRQRSLRWPSPIQAHGDQEMALSWGDACWPQAGLVKRGGAVGGRFSGSPTAVHCHSTCMCTYPPCM